MSNLLDIINKFDKLTFQFKANVEYPFASKSSNKPTIELIEWECVYINQLSPQDFISKLSQLEEVPKIIKNKIEDNLQEKDIIMLRKASERLSTILTNYEFIENHDYKYLSNPSGSDFKFHLTKKGEEGLHYFQVTFNEEEMQNSRRSNGLDAFAKDYITSILHSVRERFGILKEELAVILAIQNVTHLSSNVNTESQKYQKKSKQRLVGEFNYCSDYFSNQNIDIVDTLRDGLIGKKMIDKCTSSTFRQIFASTQHTKAISQKIVWIGQKGAFRYFINQMIDQFEIVNIRSIKFLIANNCFTYKDSDFNFGNLGKAGKDPSDIMKKKLDAIITTAKNQYNNSAGTKK